jgi:prepilin-type N-terminal cleavage/methylation domain-containing protein
MRCRRLLQKGLSLLEILMAMIVITMVMMAVATVYPGGYKLNETNRLTSRATEIARGIVEEINARPIVGAEGVPSGNIDFLSLYSIRSQSQGGPGWTPSVSQTYMWPYHYYMTVNEWQENCPVYCWGAGDITEPNKNDALNVRKFFYLPCNDPKAPDGIIIEGITPAPDPWAVPLPAINLTDSRLVRIQVTVAWQEYRGTNPTPITKFVSLISWRTDNKIDY